MDVDTSERVTDPGEPPEMMVDAGARGMWGFEGDPIGLCTESLGFESSTEEAAAVVDEGVVEEEEEEEDMRQRWRSERVRTSKWRLEERGFPPPLTWLEGGGRRRVIMRSEREGGRLRIREVRIERPGVFVALREGGRLRLFGISDGGRRGSEEQEEEEMGRRENGDSEEKGEWERGRLMRCQEAVNGDRISVLWCNNHRYMTTA
ncbi:The fantastic four family protein [Dioscorea alata]|uniref:The fantastic four family protein n=1 Tax=Dioscorea alata TaxID=55571 RepID=A0ACB7U245_DIOAL|nr:The fantastic four family protein [Dioscorea alata]